MVFRIPVILTLTMNSILKSQLFSWCRGNELSLFSIFMNITEIVLSHAKMCYAVPMCGNINICCVPPLHWYFV